MFAPELGLRGAVINLAQFPDYEEFAANFPPMYFNSLQYQGLVFGIPYRSYLYLTYQRTDILQDLGIAPVTTWTELKSILPRLQAQGMNFALTFGISESVYADVNMFMWQYGGDDYNEDLTKSGYDSPESIAGLKSLPRSTPSTRFLNRLWPTSPLLKVSCPSLCSRGILPPTSR